MPLEVICAKLKDKNTTTNKVVVEDEDTKDLRVFCATPEQMAIFCAGGEDFWIYYDSGNPNFVDTVSEKT